MDNRYKPIGVFDSGLGGLSVLKEAVKLLPHEDFIYYGDTKNAPYGTRKVSEIRYLSNRVVDFLIDKDVKAIVIACNTATSAAVNELRDKYSIPIIGIEPALKPAVEMNRVGKIIIMATPVTLSEKKFSNLMDKYKKDAEIVSLPCPGLVEFIENGNIEGEEIENYLEEKFKPYKGEEIAAIVLGCTHYPFIKKQIVKVIHKNVPIIDGSEGTSKQLKRKLEKLNLTNDKREQGNVTIYNSLEGEKVIELSYRLMGI